MLAERLQPSRFLLDLRSGLPIVAEPAARGRGHSLTLGLRQAATPRVGIVKCP